MPARTLPQPGRLFADNFSSATSGLPLSGYVSNGYRMTADANTLSTVAYPAPLPAGDATYEVQARKTSGADDTIIGLVVRRADDQDALYFVVADDGAFNILMKVKGSMRSLSSGWHTSSAIAAGATNDLLVQVVGSVYTFMVNGRMLSHVPITDNDAPASFGFLTGGGRQTGGEVIFMNYVVTTP